ncbi:MAG: hypothetical protein J6U64_03495 [Alphaproteobacteria bacterium]|nr:hypothetical protein [Alphaproteobacteria bacterium]
MDMEVFVLIKVIGFLICVGSIVLLALVPIIIAKSRGIMGSELKTIRILSWGGLLFVGITWFVALVMSLVFQPKKWIDKEEETDEKEGIDLDSLEKLHDLKEKGILSEKEYIREKNKRLGR